MGIYPGDGQTERFVEIGHAALDGVEKHLLHLKLPPNPAHHHFVLLDNGFQCLIRAAAQDGSEPLDVINAIAHSVALQMYANGAGAGLMNDFTTRVTKFLREIAADQRAGK